MSLVSGSSFLDDFLAEDEPGTAVVTDQDVTLAFTLKRVVLHGLLEKAATVLPTRDIMPVLKNFRVEAAAGRLRVIATDMELSMIAVTEMVTVTVPGIAVFPGKKLLEITRHSADADVHVTVTGHTAEIAVGRATFNVRLQGGHDYPDMPDIGDAAFYTVDRTDFLHALDAVRHAACRDVNRDNLMMIDVANARMVACDGSRFQMARVSDIPFDFRIPTGAVDDLVKLLRSTDLVTVACGESANHLIFKLGSDLFIVAKLVAAFPDMEQILLRPALANTLALTVDRTELLEAVKRIRIAADTETSALALTLTPGQLTLTAQNKVNDAAHETIAAGWTGKEHTVVVNHVFLTDMVKTNPSPSLTFFLGEDTKSRKAPLLLRDEENGVTGVVQQMIIDWTST